MKIIAHPIKRIFPSGDRGRFAMLFTATLPCSQGDRIVLFDDPDDARRHAGDDRTIFEVAVDLDISRRRLTSRNYPETASDPDWATPAFLEQYGRVMARGPIPGELFQNAAVFAHGRC